MAAVVNHMFRLALQNRISLYRYYGSALYITGDKAKDVFSVITPHFDIEDRFKKMTVLKQSVDLRGLQINVDKIKSMWDILKSVEADKRTLEKRRIDIAKQINEIKNSADAHKEIEKLKLQGKLLREDLKTTMRAVWEIEKQVVTKVLSLPNDLHPDTPNEEPKIINRFGNEFSTKQTESHVEIGKKLNILDFINPMCYYLKGEAALFELCILNYVIERLHSHNFVKFCNSDFSRSVVVEGCGLDHEDPQVTYILQDTEDMLRTKDDNRLHLIGGASLASFCSFHAKQIISVNALPLKLVTMGRQYKPETKNQGDCNSLGLFETCQASAVELFISTVDNLKVMMDEFNSTVETVTNIYTELGYPFRVVYVPARSLRSYESLKASFQMYSPHLQSYVEIGHISICDDYISKRLLIRYETERQLRFTHIISGTVLSVPKLLGCILELNHGTRDLESILIPEVVKQQLF